MIVACGPESNGTRFLARLLISTDEPVVHRSLPHGKHWWTTNEFPSDAIYVAIFRDIDQAVESVLRRGHIEEPVPDKRIAAYAEQKAARAYISSIPGVIIIQYEDLVDKPDETVLFLRRRLGMTVNLEEQIIRPPRY